MLGTNLINQRYQSNKKISYDIGRNNYIQSQPNINNNSNTNDLNLLYQTPIKQFENIPNNSNYINTPFRFDFNYYFGNLWSAGQIPNNQFIEQNINLSPNQMNKENLFLYKKSIERTYRLTPISQMKNSSSNSQSQNNSNNSISNYNNCNNNSNFLNPNNEILENNKINEIDYKDNYNNLNINELSKKNLSELFNNAKNEHFLSDTQNRKIDINNNIQKKVNNNIIDLKNDIRKKNCNLQISHQFIFSSPRNIKKPKKIFECSGSTLATNTSNRNINKKRRFRKNKDQLFLLNKFYNEHKCWSKNQIKEISQKAGLKENKVYKWLWDQRNKEIKLAKFVVNKGNNS
jgi:hypothetical protein